MMEEIGKLLPWMIRYAGSLSKCQDDAEDLAMDSYLKACKSDGYKAHKGSTMANWLATIIENTAIDRARKSTTKNGDRRLWSLDGYDVDPDAHANKRVRESLSDDPWTDVDTSILADSLLEPFTDGEIELLILPCRKSADKLGTDRWNTLRKKKGLQTKLQVRSERIIGTEEL